MEEEWRPVIGLEKQYEVSNYGDVRNKIALGGLPAGYHPFQLGEKNGRRMVSLVIHEQREVYFVDELVATAFIGPIPEGQAVWHSDGNLLNNRVDNLEFVDRSLIPALRGDMDDDFDDFDEDDDYDDNIDDDE